MKSRFFYGWINLVLAGLIMFFALGMGNSTLTQFLPLIAEDLSAKMSQITILISCSALSIAVFGAFVGKAIAKIGKKRIIYLGIILYSLSLLLLSFAKSLPLVYLAGIIMGAGITYATSITLSMVINAWFIEKRGMALGIVFAASGIGGSIFNPLIARLIMAVGYRKAFLYEAIIIFVISMIACFFLVMEPKDIGQRPLGFKGEGASKGSQNKSISTDVRKIYRSKPFIFLLLSSILFAMAIQPTMYNFFPHYSKVGFDHIFIARLISIVSLVNIGAKLIMGYLNDRFGLLPAISLGFISFFISNLAMLVSDSRVSAYLSVIAYGFALTMVIIPLPLIVPRLFGTEHYTSLIGVLTAFLTIGSSVGTPLSSFIFDRTGSFNISFIGQGILIVISYILFLLALKTSKERR